MIQVIYWKPRKRPHCLGIVGCNLIKLDYQEFTKKYPIEAFSSFQCQQNVDPLLFSQLCVYYDTDIRPTVVNEVKEGDCVYTESIVTSLDGDVVYKKTTKIVTAFWMALCANWHG